MDPTRLYQLVCEVQDQIRSNERQILEYNHKITEQNDELAGLRIELQRLKPQPALYEKKNLLTEQEAVLNATTEHLSASISTREDQLNASLKALLYSQPAAPLVQSSSLKRCREHVAAWKEIMSMTAHGKSFNASVLRSELDRTSHSTTQLKEKVQHVVHLATSLRAKQREAKEARLLAHTHNTHNTCHQQFIPQQHYHHHHHTNNSNAGSSSPSPPSANVSPRFSSSTAAQGGFVAYTFDHSVGTGGGSSPHHSSSSFPSSSSAVAPSSWKKTVFKC